jgi:alpha-1,6-mannosyltransferase
VFHRPPGPPPEANVTRVNGPGPAPPEGPWRPSPTIVPVYGSVSRPVLRPDTSFCQGATVRSDHALAAATGGAGSLLIAIGGPLGRSGLVCAYAGIALLVLGWWWYGRAGAASPRRNWLTLWLWAAPFMMIPPLFSRDVYSYLATGLMLEHGIDVYRHGPAVLGGTVALQVPELWQWTPSPYGPVSLIMSRMVTAITGTNLMAGVVGMRLFAVASLALIALVLPRLARASGVREADAWWLVVLNPLTLIHLIAGAHNDALMVGLLSAGLALAVMNRPLLGAAVVTLAALVKAPAALGLAAVAMIWAARLPGRLPFVRASLAAGGAGIATTVGVTYATGYGYGWITALRTPISSNNWSLTGLLGRWTADTFTHNQVGASLAVNLWRWGGILVVAVVAGLVWAYRDRIGALSGLGLVLLAFAAFGPAFRPWYVIWGLIPLAAALPSAHRKLALLCALLTPAVLPDGYAADLPKIVMAVLGVALGVAVFALATTTVPQQRAFR